MYYQWQEYKQNKLAAKQADKMFHKLLGLFNTNAPYEVIQQYYSQLHKTHLYNKHSPLYCQVLADVQSLRK